MQTVVLPPSPGGIARAAEALRAGELVAMPTETVYGLAGKATDPAAVAAIFAAKERPSFDPLIVHVPAPRDAAAELPERGLIDAGRMSRRAVERLGVLSRALWPGPLTLVLPRGPAIPDLVTSGLDTVAVRSPGHPVAQALLAATGEPLAAPSANRFGRVSPTTAAHVLEELEGRIGWVLDGGPASIGVESTVVAIAGDAVTLLRPGSISQSELSRLLGEPVLAARSGDAVAAPGMLERHYAPGTTLLRLPAALDALDEAGWRALEGVVARTTGRVALLLVFGSAAPAAAALRARLGRDVGVMTLSERGDVVEAARELFATLRALDALGAELLITEPGPPGEGLLHAVADRLRRASTPLS